MDVVFETSGPLLARSTLVGRGRVARTISILLKTSFSARGSWVAVGGFMALGAMLWFAFFSFSMTQGYSATSEGLSEKVGTLAILSLPTSATSEAVSILELDGPDAQMAGG